MFTTPNVKALLVAALLLPGTALAIDACIQDPKRPKADPCPHQIYKLMKLKKDEPAKITCICLTDFQKFLTPPKDATEEALRGMELRSLAADLQLTEEQVANLAKR